MYEAFNKRVVAVQVDTEKKTNSGIYTGTANNAVATFKVVSTNSLTKELQDRIIYTEARYLNYKLPDNGPDGETYYVIPSDEILAIKHGQ